MCLKFLLEGNAENQALVSSLEAREVATPDAATQEVIDKMSLKFQLNKDGKVELNEKEVAYLRNLAAETQRKPLRSSTKDNARAPLDPDTANSALVTKTNKGKGKEKATSEDEIEFM
jgi:hypothetical protein